MVDEPKRSDSHRPAPHAAGRPRGLSGRGDRSIDRFLRRPRLSAAAAVFGGVAVGAATTTDWRTPTILLVAWNAAALLHLTAMGILMARSDAATTLKRARRLDEGAWAVLALSTVAGLAGLAAIVFELASVRDLTGLARAAHIGLAAVTLATAWAFIQVMFAVHYAHAWVIAHDDGAEPGLKIPGQELPDYWDFLYVAVTIGTSAQTADVEFTSKAMRRVGLFHNATAFVFNTTVLALTINIAAGLI